MAAAAAASSSPEDSGSTEDASSPAAWGNVLTALRNARSANRTAVDPHLFQLYCRTGFHLQIHANGLVNGTRDDHTLPGIMEIVTAAVGMVSIRGIVSERYLCMNRKARLFGSIRKTDECIFVEKLQQDSWFNTYSSYKYSLPRRRWYVALNKRGKSRRGDRSRPKQKFAQFLSRQVDVQKLLNLYAGNLPARLKPDGRTASSAHSGR